MNDPQPPYETSYRCPFCQKPHDDIEALTRHLMFENCRIESMPGLDGPSHPPLVPQSLQPQAAIP